jgi:hypothetical protein
MQLATSFEKAAMYEHDPRRAIHFDLAASVAPQEIVRAKVAQ